jgi:salicylate synthetase
MTPVREFHLHSRATPDMVLQALLREGCLIDDFFLYAGPTETRIAGNWQAKIWVSSDNLAYERGGRVAKAELSRDPLTQVGQELAGTSGWRTAYGYLAFDLSRFYFDYPWTTEWPLLQLCLPRTELVLKGNSVRLRTTEDPKPISKALDGLDAEHRRPQPTTGVTVAPVDREEFCHRVEEIQALIRRGQLKKAIVSRRHRSSGQLDLIRTYACAANSNRSSRSFCFRFGQLGAVGFSPEVLIKGDAKGRVITNPLAGTRPRGIDSTEDHRLGTELFDDAKELKEHAISVILAYEELSAVCRPRSVRIADFMEVRKFDNVQHLSSHVSGQLSQGRTSWDIIRAVFPGVTVSGIPKADAVHCIGALEGRPRGIYGGAVGWTDYRGRFDFAIALRTAFQYGEEFELAAGAGILAESHPEREYAESVMKMNAIAKHIVMSSRHNQDQDRASR